MSTELPVPEPVVTPETAPYWAAAAEGKLLLTRCADCGEVIWYPRSWCPFCASGSVDWVEASGRGTVYSCTTVRRGVPPAYADAAPYVLAYVELDEGPRVLTNIRTEDPGAVAIGRPVEVVFDPVGETALPRFRVVSGAGSDG